MVSGARKALWENMGHKPPRLKLQCKVKSCQAYPYFHHPAKKTYPTPPWQPAFLQAQILSAQRAARPAHFAAAFCANRVLAAQRPDLRPNFVANAALRASHSSSWKKGRCKCALPPAHWRSSQCYLVSFTVLPVAIVISKQGTKPCKTERQYLVSCSGFLEACL